MPDVYGTARQAATASTRRADLALRPLPTINVASSQSGTVRDFTGRLARQDWQTEAYQHVDQIPELGYVLERHAEALATGRFVVVIRDEYGTVIPPERDADNNIVLTPEAEAGQRVLYALRGSEMGDQKGFLAAFGMHDPIAGEALLIGDPVDTDGEDTAIDWDIVSILEIVEDTNAARPAGSRVLTRQRSASKSGRLSVANSGTGNQDAASELSPDTYISRYSRRSAAYSGDATSVLKRNSTVCREIVLLDQLKEVMILSRLSAKIMMIPEEVTFTNPDEGIESVDQVDELLEIIIEHVTAPIEDRGSMASHAPLIIRAPAEMIDYFKMLSIAGELDLEKVKMARDDALGRLANGLDAPPESMTGIGQATHWNGAAITEDEVRKHLIPRGDRAARFVTSSYFRRMLIIEEDVDPDIAERMSVEYDASELLTRMDAAASADSLHDALLISDDARVEAHGFDPDSVRPSPEERTRRILERLSIVPHQSNRRLIEAVLDLDLVNIDPGVLEDWLGTAPTPTDPPPNNETNNPPATGGPGGPPIDQGDTPDDPTTPDTDPTELALIERIRTGASLELQRQLERAANRVATASKRLPDETRARVDSGPRTGPDKPELLTYLKPADWTQLGLTPDTLINGSFAPLEQQIVWWVRSHYTTHGTYTATQADQKARDVAAAVRQEIDRLAQQAFTVPLIREPDTGLLVSITAIEAAFRGHPQSRH